MKRPVVLALALVLGACRTPAPPPAIPPATAVQPPAAAPVHLTLVGTNDFHGWLEPKITERAGRFEWGGAAILASYVRILRAKNPGGVLLLDAGDLFQGTLASNVTEGKAVIDAFNTLQYTAAAIGNHEFDYGPEGPAVMATRPDEDAFGALTARIREARFPLLSLNIYDAVTGERPAWLANEGWVIVEARGVKVGILGLTTPQTPYTTNPANVRSLRFGALVPEVRAAAAKVREKGADLIVVVAHAGGKCGKVTAPTDLSTCDQEHGEIFRMLNELPPGTVDAVVAGHVHTRLGHYVNGTPVISTFGMGKTFGVIDLWWDPQTRKVARSEIRAQIPLCLQTDGKGSCDPMTLAEDALPAPATFEGEPVQADPQMVAVLQPHLDRVREEQQKPLGVAVPKPLGRDYEAESALGDVLVDALREMEKADVGVMNSGGLRADLPAGALTYGRVYEVMPFDNTVATLTLTGEELRKLLDAAYGARKGAYQVSGLKVSLSRCPGPGRLRRVTRADGKPLVPSKRYRVVMPDFLARGGDGLSGVVSALPGERVDLGSHRSLNFRDALVAFWQKRGRPLIPPKRGRISFLDDGASCAQAAPAPAPAPPPG